MNQPTYPTVDNVLHAIRQHTAGTRELADSELEALLEDLSRAGATRPAGRGWLARAEALHEQAGMPWHQAHELALTEHGIGTAAIDELIGECAPRGTDSLLATEDELRAFCRAVLVFGEALP